MIDYERQRARKREERRRRPGETREQARLHKRAQREREAAALDGAIGLVVGSWSLRGRRGVPWMKRMQAALRETMEAAERYAEVR